MRELLKYSQLSPRPDLRFIQSSYMEFASFSAQILLVEVLNIAYMYTYMSQGRLFNSMNNTVFSGWRRKFSNSISRILGVYLALCYNPML